MGEKNALVAGGSGLVGRACTLALLERPEFGRVIFLTRRHLPDLAHPKLSQVLFSRDTVESLAVPPVSDVFCALGTTIRKAGSQQAFREVDFELPLAVARLGLRHGARTFVLCSSVGADPASGNFYLRTKGELEQALRALPFDSLQVLRPSILVGHRQESRPGEAIGILAGRAFQFLLLGPLRRYRPIAAETVGRAMVGLALRGPAGQSVCEYDEIVRFSGACPI